MLKMKNFKVELLKIVLPSRQLIIDFGFLFIDAGVDEELV